MSLFHKNAGDRSWISEGASGLGKIGTMGSPTIGEFKNGRGEFFDTEPPSPNGRAILVRFVWSDITPNSANFKQSFSDDGGKTWEFNWITDQTRMKDEAVKAKVSLSRSMSGATTPSSMAGPAIRPTASSLCVLECSPPSQRRRVGKTGATILVGSSVGFSRSGRRRYINAYSADRYW
jgi:hypothetical protein